MEIKQSDINLFVETVQKLSDYDFSDYSVKSFSRRLEKLTGDYKSSVEELTKKMRKDRRFLEKLVKEITVNTTELFRDPPIWQSIRKMVIPRFSNEEFINVWHAGASTGQEVYSLLILMHQLKLFDKTRVYATDLNEDVLELSASGVYRYREIDEYIENYNAAAEGIKVPKIKEYMDISRKRSTIKIKPFLTQKPVFQKHDLVSLKRPFDRKLHIIFCRNVLIYFNHELQNRIFEMFRESLHPGGALIIGKHEGILGEVGMKFEKFGTIYFKK